MAGKSIDVLCMATQDKHCNFKPQKFQRRALGDLDVLVDMKYCGICHSDLHFAAGHMGLLPTSYPCVPGHELAGVVAAVGAKVKKVRVGDHIGIGCMVDSCMNCAACLRGEEQKCMKQVATYNGKDNGSGRASIPCGYTLGGYTDKTVVTEHFCVIIPKEYPLAAAGPVMCSGVTLFDPLRRYGATKGTRVGVVGIGGLGQMGVKLAKAMGCTVTAITRSAGKAAFAKSKCGADFAVLSTDPAAMAKAAGSLDLILNTIPIEHDYMLYRPLLAKTRTSKMVMLGLNSGLVAGFAADAIVCGGSRIGGSGIGGIEATQACIDLCAKHNITPEITVVPVEEINKVYEKLDAANESGERYVIDIAGSLNEGAFARCADVAPPKLSHTPALSVGKAISAVLGMLCCCRYR